MRLSTFQKHTVEVAVRSVQSAHDDRPAHAGETVGTALGALVGCALVGAVGGCCALVGWALVGWALVGGALVGGALVGTVFVGTAAEGEEFVGAVLVGTALVGDAAVLVGAALVGGTLVGGRLVGEFVPTREHLEAI